MIWVHLPEFIDFLSKTLCLFVKFVPVRACTGSRITPDVHNIYGAFEYCARNSSSLDSIASFRKFDRRVSILGSTCCYKYCGLLLVGICRQAFLEYAL